MATNTPGTGPGNDAPESGVRVYDQPKRKPVLSPALLAALVIGLVLVAYLLYRATRPAPDQTGAREPAAMQTTTPDTRGGSAGAGGTVSPPGPPGRTGAPGAGGR